MAPELQDMRIVTAGCALLAAVALAACGSASTTTIRNASGSGGASVSGSAGATATVTRTATADATPGAETHTAAVQSGSGGAALATSSSGAPGSGAGAPACQASDLALSFLGQQGATGHGELGFALRNTGPSSCSTGGYPGVQFLDRGGGALTTTPDHTTSDFFGATSLRTLIVAAGQTVSFRLGVTHGAGSSAGCTTAYALQAIAPNDSATLSTAVPGGAAECGSATVSPLQPGSSAYP